MKNVLVCLILILLSDYSFATSLTSKTSLSSTSYDESLSGSGDFIEMSRAKDIDGQGWNVSIDTTQTNSTDSSGNAFIEHSYTFTGGLSIDKVDGWGLEGDYDYSTTPEESLRSNGPEFYLIRNFDIGEKNKIIGIREIFIKLGKYFLK